MDSNSSSFVATVIHEIKSSLRGEPHTFNEIRYMIEDARIAETEFIEVLHQHHRFLNESIVVLTDHDSLTVEKQIHLDRFLRLFEMHGHAEEETLYRSLIRHENHDVKREGLVGQDEHDIAFKLVNDLKVSDYMVEWTDDVDAKAQVLANLVAGHLLEEEGVLFPLARRALLAGEMLVLAADYLDLCEFYLDGEARVLAPESMTWPILP